MDELRYVYAVARIRYNEMKLLSNKDMEQLIGASGYDDALKKIGDLGYGANQSGGFYEALEEDLVQAWELLLEIAPDPSLLEVFGVINAFHNLKSALKTRVSGSEEGPYYLKPSCADIFVIDKAVSTHNFSILPDYMREAAEKSYRILTENSDGQLGEAVIDKAALRVFIEFAERTGCIEVIKAANLKCAAADMKIAYRGATTGKGVAFYEASLCPCEGLDTDLLAQAAQKGARELIEYLRTTEYKDAAKLLASDFVAFEKWCDDRVIGIFEPAKSEAFGFSPLAAYWIAKETQMKNIRILMSAKNNDTAENIIRERIRRLYV